MPDVPDTLLVLTRDLPADDPVYEALGIGSEAAQALLAQRDMVLDALPEDRSWEITLIAQATGSKDLDKMNRLEARVTTELALRQAQGWGFRVTNRTREQKGECLFEHLLGTLEGREKELYVTVKNGFLLVLSMNVYQGADRNAQRRACRRGGEHGLGIAALNAVRCGERLKNGRRRENLQPGCDP